MKKIASILIVIAILALASLTGCSTAESPFEVGAFEEYTKIINPVFSSGVCRKSWAIPEDIEPDTLCSFYGYVILYLEENPSGWDDKKEVSTSVVLEGLSRYFDGITESQLIRADCYDADKDIFAFGYGFGGATRPEITDVRYVDGNTVIYYDSVIGNDKNGEGILAIKEIGEAFHLLSNEYTATL